MPCSGSTLGGAGESLLPLSQGVLQFLREIMQLVELLHDTSEQNADFGLGKAMPSRSAVILRMNSGGS